MELPDEILLLIFSRLRSNHDRFALLRVCRMWRRVGLDATLLGRTHSLRHAILLSHVSPGRVESVSLVGKRVVEKKVVEDVPAAEVIRKAVAVFNWDTTSLLLSVKTASIIFYHGEDLSCVLGLLAGPMLQKLTINGCQLDFSEQLQSLAMIEGRRRIRECHDALEARLLLARMPSLTYFFFRCLDARDTGIIDESLAEYVLSSPLKLDAVSIEMFPAIDPTEPDSSQRAMSFFWNIPADAVAAQHVRNLTILGSITLTRPRPVLIDAAYFPMLESLSMELNSEAQLFGREIRAPPAVLLPPALKSLTLLTLVEPWIHVYPAVTCIAINAENAVHAHLSPEAIRTHFPSLNRFEVLRARNWQEAYAFRQTYHFLIDTLASVASMREVWFHIQDDKEPRFARDTVGWLKGRGLWCERRAAARGSLQGEMILIIYKRDDREVC